MVSAQRCLCIAGLCGVMAAPPGIAAAAPDLQVVQVRGGLPNTFAQLKDGKLVTIAYFGGSITAGAGATRPDETSYRGLVGRWFKDKFPDALVTNVNAAIGGTGSDLGAFRLQRDVLPQKPDLVFVEYAVNDSGAPDAMVDRAMEGIVRQIWRADPRTDICFVYTFVLGWLPELKEGRVARTVQRSEVIAERYGIPSVNVAVPAAQRIQSGQIAGEAFSADGVHPTDAGYRIYADALIGFLESQRAAAQKPRDHALPRPLREDNLAHARMLGPDDLMRVVTRPPAGWSVSSDDPTGAFGKLLTANQPGSEMSVRFMGPILAMFYVLGPDTGGFDYRIDSGTWQVMDPFDQWAKGGYRPHYRLLADGLSDGEHTVTLRVRAEHHADSKGTMSRIGYLLANSRRGQAHRSF